MPIRRDAERLAYEGLAMKAYNDAREKQKRFINPLSVINAAYSASTSKGTETLRPFPHSINEALSSWNRTALGLLMASSIPAELYYGILNRKRLEEIKKNLVQQTLKQNPDLKGRLTIINAPPLGGGLVSAFLAFPEFSPEYKKKLKKKLSARMTLPRTPKMFMRKNKQYVPRGIVISSPSPAILAHELSHASDRFITDTVKKEGLPAAEYFQLAQMRAEARANIDAFKKLWKLDKALAIASAPSLALAYSTYSTASPLVQGAAAILD